MIIMTITMMMMNMIMIRKREEHALVSPGEETRWLPALLLSEVCLDIFCLFIVVLIIKHFITSVRSSLRIHAATF